MLKATGFVTAGGQSSRMGRDKAWLEVGGRAMIERVIEALKPVTVSLNLIANNDSYRRLGLPVCKDTYADVGPLEAIRTALANSATPWVILVGCDLPFVTTELFAFLLSIAEPEPETRNQKLETNYPASAIVPLNAEGLIEPLCALYSTTLLAAVTDLIASGERKVSWLFERAPTRFISFDELRKLRDARLFFTNINTPEEYSEALKEAGPDG